MTDKKYSIEEVFNMIGEEYLLGDKADKRKGDIEVDGYIVHRESLRYKTFYQRGIKCACCGKEGAYFKLDIERGQDEATTTRRHFNLYTDDDVLMTKDHIVPKSKGGPDIVSNMQPMCVHCNTAKGNHCPGLETEYIVATSKSTGKELVFTTIEKAAYHMVTNYGQVLGKKVGKNVTIKAAITTVLNIQSALEHGHDYIGHTWKKEMR